MKRAEIEAKAKRLGRRRARHATEGEEIQGEVTKVVAQARTAGVPMEHLAELLGMHRSSLYELYIGETDAEGRQAA